MNSQLHILARKSILWNAVESVCYQLIYCGHQVLLFSVTESSVYGLTGVLFSAIYTIITLINVGFDQTVGAWWQEAIRNKQAFTYLILVQCVPQVLLTIPALIGLYYYSKIDFYLLSITGLIIVLQSAKRTLKQCLYLLFANHVTAPAEIIFLVSYVIIVWTSIWTLGAITATVILLPMVISSCIPVMIYGWHLLQFFQKLPSHTDDIPLQLKTIVTMRLTNYTTQLTHLLFSGNVLIPLFALRFGLATAGTLKLVNTIAYGFGTLMYKIVGTTSQVLFAHTKNSGHIENKEIFAACTNKIYQLLYLAGIFLLINSYKMGTALAAIGIVPALLFAATIITENVSGIYEQFLTTRNCGYYNALLQITSFVITYGLVYQSTASLSSVLGLLLSLRIMMLICFEIIVRYHWSIKSDVHIEPLYGISALIISLIFFWTW